MDLVHAEQPFAVEWDGITQVFNPGRVFEPHHPLVRAYPDRFVPVAPLPLDVVDTGKGVTRAKS